MQCMMVLAAVSLTANIFVVRLHEKTYTSRMSTTMRYLIFRIIAPALCYGSKQVACADEAEHMDSLTDGGSPKKENHSHLNAQNMNNKEGDITSLNENTRHSNARKSLQSFPRTNIGAIGWVKEERRVAADILDRFFLVVFCILFITIGTYSFIIG